MFLLCSYVEIVKSSVTAGPGASSLQQTVQSGEMPMHPIFLAALAAVLTVASPAPTLASGAGPADSPAVRVSAASANIGIAGMPRLPGVPKLPRIPKWP
jgi:hypothetical protein